MKVPLKARLGGALAWNQTLRSGIFAMTPQFSTADANHEVSSTVNMESTGVAQPGMAERAIDTATDVSRTITEVSAALQAAVDRLGEAIASARQPGKPLSTISAITREAPLASLFVAFLFGVAVARRR